MSMGEKTVPHLKELVIKVQDQTEQMDIIRQLMFNSGSKTKLAEKKISINQDEFLFCFLYKIYIYFKSMLGISGYLNILYKA